jgi:glycogen synthase
MRILLVGAYPPPHGGLQTNLVAIRNLVRRRGHRCMVINITRHRRANADDVFYPETGLGVFRLLLTLRYDIVHLHIGGNLNPRLLLLCLVCSLIPRRKAVLTFHSGGYPASPEGKAARPRTFRGFIFRRLDRIIAVNPEIVELFHRFGVPPFRVRLIYPFAIPPPSPDTQFSPDFDAFWRAHSHILLTVGLLEPEYDLPLQIEAMGEIRLRFPDAGLVIIGSGSLEQALRETIASKPWAEHVLLCGDVPHPVTLRAIAECSILLRTTIYDGDAISVREALHLGTPVIATDNGMRPEGVRLIPAQNLPSLCRAVGEILEKPRAVEARAAAGQENIEAVLDVYTELLDE